MGYVQHARAGLGAISPRIEYARGITTLPGWAADWLADLMIEAGVSKVQVSSTVRTTQQQAKIMYDAGNKNGVDYLRGLYKFGNGKAVVDAYALTSTVPGIKSQQVIDAMAAQIAANPAGVSSHVISDDDDGSSFTFDVGPNASFGSDTGAYQRFLDAALARRGKGEVKTLIYPPQDDGIHFKLVQNDLAGSSMQALKNALVREDSEGEVAPGGVPIWAWAAGALAAAALYLRRRK
jgi:MYXO-CTERM domain-containing protein